MGDSPCGIQTNSVATRCLQPKARGKTLEQVLGAANPWWEVLTAKERENLGRYTKQFGDSRGTGFNLTQNPEKRAIVTKVDKGPAGETNKVLFTLLHNAGVVWWCGGPCERGRFLCPVELALYQGIPPRASFSKGVPASSFAMHPNATRGRTAFAGQVGNSMNTAVVGAFVRFGCMICVVVAWCGCDCLPGSWLFGWPVWLPWPPWLIVWFSFSNSVAASATSLSINARLRFSLSFPLLLF